MTGPGLPAYGAVYEYQTNSNLVRQISFKSSGSAMVGTIVRTFEEHRDVVTDVENNWGTTPTLVSKYHYGDADVLGRHTSVATTGSAFSPGRFILDTPRRTESAARGCGPLAAARQAASQGWTYDARNELLTSRRYNGINISDTSSPVTTQSADRRIFDYDSTLDDAAHRKGQVGNRDSYQGDGVEGARTYTANQLNQYARTDQPKELFAYDADPGRRFAPSRAGGNLTEDGKQTYTWDGENRLRSVTPKNPTTGLVRVQFTYDYLGPRVRKEGWPGSGYADSERAASVA